MALRDKGLYGITLLREATPSLIYARPDPNNPSQADVNNPIYDFNAVQYIFQPPDYVQNEYHAGPPTPTNPTKPMIEFHFPLDGGLGPTPAASTTPVMVPVVNQKLWPVQVGDVIKLENGRYPFVIAGIWTQTDLTTGLLRWFVETITDPSPVLPALATPPAPQVWAKDFRIMRQARPVPGEEIIKLPDSLVI